MTKPQENYWNDLSAAYQSATRISTNDFHYGPLLPGDQELRLLPQPLSGKRCLEIGGGAGQNSIYLAQQGAECTILDISENQLEHGRQLAKKLDVSITHQEADMDELPVSELGTFDFIHSTYALPFSDQPEKVLSDCYQLLRPGGTFLLSVGHPVYAGEWVEIDDGEEGQLLPNYFHPPSDTRVCLDDETCIYTRFYPLSTWCAWLRQCEFQIDQLLEPAPLPIHEMSEEEIQQRVPYESADWRKLHYQLARVPIVAIFRCFK